MTDRAGAVHTDDDLRRATSDPASAAEVDALKGEVAALRGQLASQRTGRHRRIRAVVSWVLVVLAVLVTSLSVLSIWAFRTLTDTELFVDRVGPVLQDPAVTAVIGERAASRLVAAVDLQQRLEQRLPEGTTVLAAPVTQAVEDRVAARATALAGSDRFQQALERAVAGGHRLTIAILAGQDTAAVENADGTIVLDLTPVINELLADSSAFLSDVLGRDVTAPAATPDDVDAAVAALEAALGTDLPVDVGTVTLYSSDDLAAAQAAYRAMRVAVWLAPLLAVILVIGAIAVAVDRVRAALALVVGVAAVMVLVALALRPLEESVVDAVADVGLREAVRTGFTTVLAPLVEAIVVLGWLGLLAAVALVLLGDSRPARAGRAWVRRSPRLAAEHRVAFLVGGGAVALLVLAPAPGRTWTQLMVALLLYAGYAVAVLVAPRRPAEAVAPSDPG